MNAKEFFKSKYPEEGGYFACFHDEDMIEFAEAYRKHRIEVEKDIQDDLIEAKVSYLVERRMNQIKNMGKNKT